MKILVADKVVATSHDFPSVNCTIDAEDMRYISSLLRNNYSNTILATIRETYANAVDANIENGLNPESIEIKCPTSLDQTYSVRDFGAGLSRDQIFNLYSKFGKSTKRGSDLSIGGFGIGRFAPLSYKDSFTVTSYHNAVKTIYSIYISEENDTKIDEIFSNSTSEKNGICITVGVSKNDINKFNSEISNFFSNFEILPKILNIQTQIVKPEILSSGNGWQIRRSPNHYSSWSVGEQGIVMGGIFYPINPELVDFNDSDAAFAWTKHLNKLVFIVDIGSVSLHHSRETLEYNKTTKSYLKSRYKAFCEEFTNSIKNKIAQFDCLRDAMDYYKEIKNTFPSNAFSKLESQDVFVFKGHKITAFNFNRATYEENGKDHRIPVYTKTYSLASKDRVSVSKCYSIINDKNSYIVFHDMPDNTKIAPRVFDLLKKYSTVIVIAHDLSIISSNIVNGVNKFKEINRFDLIKSGFCNLSELTPVKLASNRKPSAVGSYTPNYFYKIDGCRFSSSSNLTSEINNTSIVKLYFPVVNSSPIKQYSSFSSEKNKVNTRIFADASVAFNIEIYGVSNNVAETTKFKNRADFVDFTKFIQNKWDSLSDNEKELVAEYFSCQNSDNCKTVIDNNSIMENVKIQNDFVEKKKNNIEALRDLNALEFTFFIYKYITTLKVFGAKFIFNNVDINDLLGETYKKVKIEIINKYPMIQIFDSLWHHEQNVHQYLFKDYIDGINKQNSVDISKI